MRFKESVIKALQGQRLSGKQLRQRLRKEGVVCGGTSFYQRLSSMPEVKIETKKMGALRENWFSLK